MLHCNTWNYRKRRMSSSLLRPVGAKMSRVKIQESSGSKSRALMSPRLFGSVHAQCQYNKDKTNWDSYG